MADFPLLPAELSTREVIFGGGPHAAIYAATRTALGHPKPVVIEQRAVCGGVFARLVPFYLNSANNASIRSVREGPSRLAPDSTSDDLNFLPNAAHQVRDVAWTEYPTSADVAAVVARNLKLYAQVFTGVTVTRIRPGVLAFQVNDTMTTYYPRRIIDARGQQMAALPRALAGCPAVITAEDFLSGGRSLPQGTKVAIVGDGDTAAIVAENLLGLSPARPLMSPPTVIGWYGPDVPMTKNVWMTTRHARYLGLARHFPQAEVTGTIRPYRERGEVTAAGNYALVNGQLYDLVIMATGFAGALSAQRAATQAPFDASSLIPVAGASAFSGREYYAIGAAAGPQPFTAAETELGFTRFPANTAALFRLGPRTAQLAASLPA